jgi:hypothetical protein
VRTASLRTALRGYAHGQSLCLGALAFDQRDDSCGAFHIPVGVDVPFQPTMGGVVARIMKAAPGSLVHRRGQTVEKAVPTEIKWNLSTV